MRKPCAHACCVLRVMLRVECSCVLLRASRRSVTTLNCYMQRRSVAVLDASRSVAAAAGCGATRQSLGSLSRGRASYTAPEPFSEHAHEQVVSRSGGAILMVESGVRCEVTAIACAHQHALEEPNSLVQGELCTRSPCTRRLSHRRCVVPEVTTRLLGRRVWNMFLLCLRPGDNPVGENRPRVLCHPVRTSRSTTRVTAQASEVLSRPRGPSVCRNGPIMIVS